MTIVGRTFEELKVELIENGYEVVCSDFFLEYNRIICQKDDHTFVLQYMKFYNYRFIVTLFRSLGIEPPKDCLHVWQQEIELMNRKNTEGS